MDRTTTRLKKGIGRWRRALILLVALTSAGAAAQDGREVRGLEDFIDQALPASAAPGLAWAMIDTGEIQSGARGERLAGSGQTLTPDTPFLLGSISKSFTALAVMQLVEAGDVSLDAPIADYLESFAGQAGAPITIRQLLSHTSGYSTLQGNTFQTGQTQADNTLTGRVRQLALATPTASAGSRWQYSNANYLILGALIETVSGDDYAGYVETHILEPAGMADSFVADDRRHDDVAVGHLPWFGTKRPLTGRSLPASGAPAGGIVASAADVARYLGFMTNGQDDLISADSKALMLRPAGPASPHYGFGWFIDEAADTAYHTGVTPGVETIAALSRSEPRAVVVLVNAGSGMGFGETADLLSGTATLGLGQAYESAGGLIWRQALFVPLVILPFIFVAGIIASVWLRSGLPAKSGLTGLFSLWFPLLAITVMAWTFIYLIPRLFGVTLSTLGLYQPDLVLVLIASAVTGLLWALLRLAIAYSPRLQRAAQH